MSWNVKEYRQAKRGITQNWYGLFSTSRKSENSPDVPVMLCTSWSEAHEILRWIQENPQQEFERIALFRLDRDATEKRKAATRSLTARNREARMREAATL